MWYDYNMSEFNTIEIKELLPELFARKKHFSPEQYYQTMIDICPECAKKWYERIPSEAQIQKMITKFVGDGHIEGKTSVPQAERTLGIKIDPGYKYPRGMTDIEYNKERFYKYGLFNPFANNADDDYKSCFDCTSRNGKTYYADKPNKTRAYLTAWRKLQYPDRDAIRNQIRTEWNQICELNPILKTIKFDTNDIARLTMAISGTIFGFQPRDIELFVNEYGNGPIGFRHSARIIRESAAAGLPAKFRFGWVPHSDTIAEIGRRYREKNLQNAMTKVSLDR